MHQDPTIINQKQINQLQRDQVPRTPTQSQRREHQMFLRGRKLQLPPKSPAVQEDTLSSSSSSDKLPMGLL